MCCFLRRSANIHPMTPEKIKASTIPLSVYGVLAAGIIAVSLAAIFIRLAQQDGVPSLLIAGARMTIASLMLTPFSLYKHSERLRQLTRKELGLAALSGVFLALHFVTWITSLERRTVLISVVLVSTGPIWVALLERFFLGTQIARAVLVGLGATVIGGVLIAFGGSGDLSALGRNPTLGSLLALLGAIALAVYLIIGRKLRAEMPLLPYIWLVYGCAAVTLIIVLIVTQTPITGYPSQSYLWMLCIALLPQLIGHTSFNYALRYLPATVVGVIGQMEPIGSSIIALFVFREAPGTVALIGSLFILAGVIAASLGQSQK